MKTSFSIALCACTMWAVPAWAQTNYTFKDAPPVLVVDDRTASPVPATDEFDFVEYAVSAAVRHPLIKYLDFRRPVRSRDVNALDEVPASSWFTPRLGYQTVGPEVLLKGPEDIGPPLKPVYAIHAKREGNSPGFIIRDARGERYLIKFDPPEMPGLETTVHLVVNRLFWGFGYNVPEDYVFHFTREDLHLGKGSTVSEKDVDAVLWFSTPDEHGRHRSTASLFIEGTVLGPLADRGRRPGDVNDRVPHEDLRVLRAQHVFSSWLQRTDVRSDNALDVYRGKPGEGHVVHYMLDFGEALGVHGAEKKRMWDGFEHFFSWGDFLKNTLTLGLTVKPWENLSAKRYDPKVHFEAEAFDPRTWKEMYPFLPIQRSRPDDDYWAAKIVAAVSRPHLGALFEKAAHPDETEAAYFIRVLMERREKILRHYFYQVSPIESGGVIEGALHLEDVGRRWLPGLADTAYRIIFYNRKGKKMSKSIERTYPQTTFSIPVSSEMMRKAEGYLRVDVRVIANGKVAPRPAQFHIRTSADGQPRLVGIVH